MMQMSIVTIQMLIVSSAPSKVRMRSAARQFAQCYYLILVHFQHSKFKRIALETLHWLCVCMVARSDALRAQQNKRLLSVEFS